MNKLNEELKRYAKKWKTTPSAVVELLKATGRKNGIAAVKAR